MLNCHSDHRLHLQRYHLEAISFENDDDDSLDKLFSLNFKFELFLWFTNLHNESIKCFNDIVKAFMDRYNLFVTQEPSPLVMLVISLLSGPK